MSYTVVNNGATYTVDDNSTVTCKTDLKDEKAERNNRMQREAGGSLRDENDQGGHLLAASLNGGAIKENLSAQNKNVNQKGFKHVENAERECLRNEEHPVESISTERIAFTSNQVKGADSRPDAYMINDTINYENGKTQSVNYSFTNLSYAKQDELDKEANAAFASLSSEYPNPGDTLRERMSNEEYNEKMNATDWELPTISDDFQYNPSNVNFENNSQSDINNSNDIVISSDLCNQSQTESEFDSSEDVDSESQNLDNDASSESDGIEL